MAAKREVQDRIVAASTLLQNMQGQDGHDEVARVQRMCVENLVRTKAMTVVELADLSSTTRDSAFPSSDKASIMKAISAAASGGKSIQAEESKFQNFTNLPMLLTAAVWTALQTSDGTSVLFNHAMTLGLREPNEFTYATLAILIIFGEKGQEAALKMTQQAKLAQVKAVKAWFKRMASRAAPPVEKIMMLPASAAALLGAYPLTYADAFPDSSNAPVACQIDPLVLEMLRSSTRCRNTLKMNFGTSVGQPMLQGLQVAPQPPQQLPFGDPQQFMSMFAAMQQFQAMMGGGHGRLPELLDGGQDRNKQLQGDVPLQFPFRPPASPQPRSRQSEGSPVVGPPVFGAAGAAQRRAEVASVGARVEPPAPSVVEAEDLFGDEGKVESDAQVEQPKQPATEASIDSASAAKRRASVAEASSAIFEAYGKIKEKRLKASQEKAAQKKADKKAAQEKAANEKAAKKGKAAQEKAPKAVKKEKTTQEKKADAPTFSHEASRHQFMARTGIRGPGNSQRFPYSAGSERSCEAAKKKATKFVIDECKKRRITVPAKFTA